MKMVVWDGRGMVMLKKVLEDRSFIWKDVKDGEVSIRERELEILIDGMEWKRVEKKKVKRKEKKE